MKYYPGSCQNMNSRPYLINRNKHRNLLSISIYGKKCTITKVKYEVFQFKISIGYQKINIKHM